MMLVNLEEPDKNDFRVVTELPFTGERDVRFRPDITVLINGIPMAFIEAKKPNNKDGIQAEFRRMREERICKDELTPFFNQLQLLGFTNNQVYNDQARTQRQGSFYTTPDGKDEPKYNHFREEQELPISEYISNSDIDDILSDNNIMSIKDDLEFRENLKPDTPANKFITSLFSKERFIYYLKYGIVYVDSPVDGFHKHIIRYPQYFGLQALRDKLDRGMKKGVLWHTQGSGKTAFSYFATNMLRDYYQDEDIITKFYFVVDRLDLFRQATVEFSARGMTIAAIDSKEDFIKNMQSQVIINDSSSQRGKYQETMNVVNIQKFSKESVVIPDPNTDVQRIYFLDEVHRGYKPKGTFLGNLLGADPKGIFIGLTGTPILDSDFGDEEDSSGKKAKHTGVKRNFKTTDIFHEYIHKYYYNKSIADGYTLKIKKENIDTKFRNDIRAMVGIPEGQAIPAKTWEDVTKSEEYVDQLCRYIIDDFSVFEEVQNDDSMGFMVVASSSEQARSMQEWFENNSTVKTALVLYDTEENKEKQEYFRGKKDNVTGKTVIKYKGVIVYNMLLTGFDAPRLKRLYLLRTIKEHNLLQTLARVNRAYRKMQYGYVVDFVDITEEYEETNRCYLEELRSDLEDEDGKPSVPPKKKNDMAIYLTFLQHILASLKEDGKAAVVVPNGFLTFNSGIQKKIRKEIVDNNWLRGVVSMPSNIFATTGTSVSIIFIDKSRNDEDEIILIDATKMGRKVSLEDGQRTILSAEDERFIINTFNRKTLVEDFSAIVSKEQIQKRRYSFSAGQYFPVKMLYSDITKNEFEEEMKILTKEINDLFESSSKYEKKIKSGLGEIIYDEI